MQRNANHYQKLVRLNIIESGGLYERWSQTKKAFSSVNFLIVLSRIMHSPQLGVVGIGRPWDELVVAGNAPFPVVAVGSGHPLVQG